GGNVRAITSGGYTFDMAANGVLPAPDTLALFDDLDLLPEPAAETAKRRYLFKDGGLHALPSSPLRFLTFPLLLPSEKIRALLEPFLAKKYNAEESIYDFVKRHFGEAVADLFAAPLVLGVSGGDAKLTSVDALFPRLRTLEQTHTSILRGLIAQQRAAKKGDSPARRLMSLPGGLGILTKTLAERLEDDIQINSGVQHINRDGDSYQLTLASGEVISANHLVVATPAHITAALLADVAKDAATMLAKIPFVDMRVMVLGYDRVDVPHPLDGFGFLVPSGQQVESLGVLFTSSLFENRVPDGKVLLRVLLGGHRQPNICEVSEEDVLKIVRRDLEITMGITVQPEFVYDIRWPKGIAQYTLGHRNRVNDIMDSLPSNLYLTGNSYYGVSVNDTISQAKTLAEVLAGRLEHDITPSCSVN
ncbi:MAG: protoporphyrinogen oxidase, partial [Deinococcota bacterium]